MRNEQRKLRGSRRALPEGRYRQTARVEVSKRDRATLPSDVVLESWEKGLGVPPPTLGNAWLSCGAWRRRLEQEAANEPRVASDVARGPYRLARRRNLCLRFRPPLVEGNRVEAPPAK